MNMSQKCNYSKHLFNVIKHCILIALCVHVSVGYCKSDRILTPNPSFYCTGDKCPEVPPGTLNNEYPHAICAKEYRCEGDYIEKIVANKCGCCACNGGSVGCAGGKVICEDGTFSQMCRCNFRLVD